MLVFFRHRRLDRIFNDALNVIYSLLVEGSNGKRGNGGSKKLKVN